MPVAEPASTAETQTQIAPAVQKEATSTPAPAPQRPAAVAPADDADDTLPIAGATGAAILLLAGGGYALMRRRRDDHIAVIRDESVAVAPPEPEPLRDPMVEAARAPVMVAPAAAAAAAMEPAEQYGTRDRLMDADPSAPVTRLPEGFDMSRYGRHVQAAYRGPTENNRSPSLRRRLARARFFDQRERMTGRDVPSIEPTMAEAAPAPARQGEFITTRINRPQRPAFKPAFSS